MYITRIIISFLMIAGLSGCGHFAKNYQANPVLESSDLLNVEKTAVDPDKLKNKIKAVKDAGENEKVALRDELLQELIRISDNVCSLHEATIMSNANTWNVSTGTISGVFSALGTVVGGEATKAGLAAAATITNSTRELVNAEVYSNAFSFTIVRAIELSRTDYRGKMAAQKKDTMDAYSVQEGLIDVQEYHRRCSFYYGLLEVTKALDYRKPSKNEVAAKIEVLKKQTWFVDESDQKGPAHKKLEELSLQMLDARD